MFTDGKKMSNEEMRRERHKQMERRVRLKLCLCLCNHTTVLRRRVSLSQDAIIYLVCEIVSSVQIYYNKGSLMALMIP